MQDPPAATDLLEAMADFLESEVLPDHQGRKAFLVRVVINLCRILARESRLETAFLQQEVEMLASLLGQSAGPVRAEDLRAEVRRLHQDLARRVRTGEMDYRQPEVLVLIRELVRRKLLIARPDYMKSAE